MAETVADIVSVLFRSDGVQDMARAFDSVEKRMAQFEKASTQNTTRGARERVNAVNTERRERESMYARLFKDVDAKEKSSVKETEKAAKQKVRAEESSARDRLRADERLARDRRRLVDTSARYAGRMAEQQATAEIRAAERAAHERKRIADREAREIRSRNANIGNRVGSIVGSATSRTLGTVAGLAGAALAIGGGFSVADALRSDMSAEKSAVGLINSLPGNQGKGMTSDGIVARAKGIQRATHVDKGAMIEGMRGYSAITGDAGFINDDKSMMGVAKLAKATGADVGNLMQFAGLIKAQNKNLDNGGIMDMLRAGTAQGMSGAIEVKDLAAIAGKITATRGAYSTNQTSAQKQLLGLAQIVFPTAGSADEAATVVSRFGQDALSHSAGLEKLGLVDKKTGTLADPDQIISKVLEKTGGNLGKIHDYGFQKESMKLFEQLSPSYREAYEAAGGDKNKVAATKAAGEKITSMITDVTGSTMDEGEVNERFARQMDTRSEKIDAAMQRLQEIVADKGVPILDKFVTALSDNMPQIEAGIGTAAKWFEWFAEHPAEGIGALILLNVGKDLAGAGIGAAVKAIITSLLTEGSAGNAAAGLLNTGGAGKGAGIPGLVGAAAITLGMLVSTASSAEEGENAGKAESAGAINKLTATEQALRRGQVSPQQADRAMRDVQGFLSTQKDNADTAHQALDLASVPLSLVSSDARKNIAQTHAADEVMKAEPQILAALKSIEHAINETGKNGPMASGGGGLSNPAHPARNGDPHAPRVAQ